MKYLDFTSFHLDFALIILLPKLLTILRDRDNMNIQKEAIAHKVVDPEKIDLHATLYRAKYQGGLVMY